MCSKMHHIGEYVNDWLNILDIQNTRLVEMNQGMTEWHRNDVSLSMNDLTISWPFRRDDEKIALIMIQKRKIAL